MSAFPIPQKVTLPPHCFAADWQVVLFRCYGKVPAERLAKVLKTDEATIHYEAERLGLEKMAYNPAWESKGYITLIKSAWHVLDYPELCVLTNMDEKTLSRTLREDDFLDVKLGTKPIVTSPVYTPLTKEQIEKTERQAKIVRANRTWERNEYFDLYKQCPELPPSPKADGLRMLYNYGAVYGDILKSGDFSSYPDEMLDKLAMLGVNALFLHCVMYDLVGFPFSDKYGSGWEVRLKNLDALSKKLKAHGIGLWLYLNEPRGMPVDAFETHPEIMGTGDGRVAAMCTSVPAVKHYLYDGVKKIATECPGLGGIFAVTSSENLTTCLSRPVQFDHKKCPRCKDRDFAEVAVEVNTIIHNAIRDSGSDIQFVAHTWGWSDFMLWQPDDVYQALSMLPKDMGIFCVSEEALVIEKGGQKTKLLDYSISNYGPSERSKKVFRVAKENGLKTYAKIQVSNSWECCTVPYLPVFELIEAHLKGLAECDVDGLWLSWTVGGYPSFNLSLASRYKKGFDMDAWYADTFGADGKAVQSASKCFSAAFKEFPFSVDVLYFGPHNAGPANLMYRENTGMPCTMTCYPFDDVEGWSKPFGSQTLLECYTKMADGWAQGMKHLENLTDQNALKLKRVATAALCHFRSSQYQVQWILTRDQSVLQKEYENTQTLLKAAAEDPAIGFEATNHYFYTENTLLEKLLNLDGLMND